MEKKLQFKSVQNIKKTFLQNNNGLNIINKKMRLLKKFPSFFVKKSTNFTTNYNKNPFEPFEKLSFIQTSKFSFSSSYQSKESSIEHQKSLTFEEKSTDNLPTKSHYEIYPIEQYEVGQRLDRYLKNTSLNWMLVQKYLRSKLIYILNKQGKKVKQNSYRLQQGDTMYIRTPIAMEMFARKQGLSAQVTYESAKQKLDELVIFDNKNITILNKPPGYSVQGGDDYEKNLFSLMAARYKRQMVHVIHRLDKPTTGVLFFCKNLRTAQLIQSAIQSRKDYNKYYLSLSIGQQVKKDQQYIRYNIQWTNKHKARIIESLQKQQSKDSITYYKKLHSQKLDVTGQQMNLLGIKLITGRKHQIRCHLTDYLYNPILNDKKYGGVMLGNNPLNSNRTYNKEANNSQQKDLVVEKRSKDQQGYIYLHALMTIIKNDQILSNVFEISEDKIQLSRSSNSIQVIQTNTNGAILLKNGHLKILGNLPQHWQSINKQPHQSTNNLNLKQIVLKYNMNQIQIAQEIEKSQTNLWRKHRPQRKVMTI